MQQTTGTGISMENGSPDPMSYKRGKGDLIYGAEEEGAPGIHRLSVGILLDVVDRIDLLSQVMFRSFVEHYIDYWRLNTNYLSL